MKELSTLEDAIAHAEKHGRDWATDRAVKHADPENRNYWKLQLNEKESYEQKKEAN